MLSKYTIRVLISLMSVALIGVILIQFLWIRNAVKVKQDQFDWSVNKALSSVSSDLENQYGVHFITERVETDSGAKNEVMRQDSGLYRFMMSVGDDKWQDDEQNVISIDSDESVQIPLSDEDVNTAERVLVSTRERRGNILAMVNVNSGGRQIVLRRSVLVRKPRPVAKPIGPNLPQQPVLAQDCKLMNIVKDAANEYEMSKMNSKDVSDIIDSGKISSAIKKEFEKQGLPKDFIFATYCVGGDTLMINKAASNHPLKDFSYKTPLLNTDFIDAGTLLLIRFPQHFKYIASSVADMVALSLFFTITMICAFAYSLHVIFQQKKLSDITNDFINNMTHELKTPLATISMTADTLGLSNVSGDSGMVNEYSGMIKNEVKKLSRHVDRILEAAVLEKNGNPSRSDFLNINHVVEDEVKVFEPLVHQKGGKIEFSSSPETVNIYATKDLLRGAICNLLDNAIKYSGEVPHIIVSVKRMPSAALVTVEDNGIGINKTDQKMIFEKFYRASTGNRHDVKGFGLGLSFVKSVVTTLHGKVWVESEPGRGSKFYIELPI